MTKVFGIGDSYDENTDLFNYLEELIQLHRPHRIKFLISSDEEGLEQIREVEYMGYLPNRMSNDNGSYPFIVVAVLGKEDFLPYRTCESTLLKFAPFELEGREQCYYVDAFEIKGIVFEYEETKQKKAAAFLDTLEDYQSHVHHSYKTTANPDPSYIADTYFHLEEQKEVS